MTDDEIQRLTEQVIGPILGPHGFDFAEVRSGFDHTDEPAVYVTAHLRPGSNVLDPKASVGASIALRRALAERGDARFPYFRYDYPDDLVILDESDIAAQ